MGLFFGAWYWVSPTTFRAIACAIQGLSCHYCASIYLAFGLNTIALSMQNLSVRGYESADNNLNSDEFKALVSDELAQLSMIYFKNGDFDKAHKTIERIEKIARSQIDNPHSDRVRWSKALAQVLLYDGRLFNARNRYVEAAAKYSEAIAINERLRSDGVLDSRSSTISAEALKEYAQLKQHIR